MKLVFSTGNQHKLQEVRELLSDDYELLSLEGLGENIDIPETGTTLRENASIKSRYVVENFQLNCIADDTGLEIDALNGEPGVYSARYAGEGCTFDDNMNKVLKKLEGEENRNARFRTVISLIINGEENFFEGEVKGQILKGKRCEKGFGYDPIFQPEGFKQSFAELSMEEKNKISHRGKAVRELVRYLNKLA